MKKSFNLTNESKLLVFGAGKLGMDTAHSLMAAGYCVVSFMDNHFKGIVMNDIQGDSPEKVASLHKEYIEYPVIVAIHNALWHCDVAEQLSKLGFQKIVFIPIESRMADEEKSNIIKSYNAILNGTFNGTEEFPYYEEINQTDFYKKCWIVKEYENDVLAWIPTVLAFSTIVKNNEALMRQYIEIKEYIDIPLSALYPHVSLFRFFEGKEGETDTYLRLYKKIQNSKDVYSNQEFILDRYNLYHFLLDEYNKGMQYFIDSALQALWNEKGYFNVIDGQHRAVFLYCMGATYMPVMMNKQDYQAWINRTTECEYNTLNENCRKDGINTSIFFPAFWGTKISVQNVLKEIDWKLRDFYANIDMQKNSIFDMCPYGAFFARTFQFKKMRNKEYICGSPKYNEIVKHLNRIVNAVDVKERDLSEIKECDIVVLIDITDEIDEETKKKRFQFAIENANVLFSNFLISEEENKLLSENGFLKQEVLGTFCLNLRQHKVICYYKK